MATNNTIAKALLLGGLLLVCLPLGALLIQTFGKTPAPLLTTTYLLKVIRTTLFLILGVGIFSTLLGIFSAWVMTHVTLPYQRLWNGLLMVPLAIPTYVYAFIYSGFFSYAGPLRPLFYEIFSPGTPYPQIHSLGGAIFVLSIGLYPYSYLLTKNGFLSEGQRSRELTQSLGLTDRAHFRRVTLPLCLPWIIGGALLIFLEVLADFGAVSLFNVATLSTAIYKTWYGGYSFANAAKLSFLLMSAALIGLSLDYHLKTSRRFTQMGQQPRQIPHQPFWVKVVAIFFLSLLILFSIGIPLCQLLVWCQGQVSLETLQKLLPFMENTLIIGFLGAALTLGIAFALSWAVRRLKSTLWTRLLPLILIGYGIPGTVLAVGCFLAFFSLRQTLFLVLVALAIRFLAVAVSPILAGYQRLSPNLEEAASSLGATPWRFFRSIEFPLLRTGLISAFLLTCVEIMKELPLTLMARPFGWDTLSVYLYQWTSESQWQEASLPALFIVSLSLSTLLLPKGKS